MVDLRKEMYWESVSTIVEDGGVGINERDKCSNYNKLD